MSYDWHHSNCLMALWVQAWHFSALNNSTIKWSFKISQHWFFQQIQTPGIENSVFPSFKLPCRASSYFLIRGWSGWHIWLCSKVRANAGEETEPPQLLMLAPWLLAIVPAYTPHSQLRSSSIKRSLSPQTGKFVRSSTSYKPQAIGRNKTLCLCI
jgi:hypothetical protein